MGVRNYLVDGVSGTGKSATCAELRRRGFRAIDGDRELSYQGDPETGEPTLGRRHENHIWRVGDVTSLIADRSDPVTFFCGGSRNVATFVGLFDGVFVLDIDRGTLNRRLAGRTGDEWGVTPSERDLVLRLHRTGQDVPDGVVIDATRPLTQVVDEIVRRVRGDGSR